uniref:Putative folate-biopterin transporter, Major facilitator superfamily domain protein n=2 Tax=Helianthus annuus TaxID=4232 RepID=A0A251RMA9_HELAN
MYKNIQLPEVWKPSLYMYMSMALSISTHEAEFYWYTDPNAGPAFSQELIGMVYAIGALASIGGTLIYQKVLKDYPFRKLLFFAQLVYGLSGFIDLMFVLRWNLILGLPDYLFLVIEECVSSVVSRVRWMPMILLSASLCPIGIEGTFFPLLMSIDSFGSLSSTSGGGVISHIFHVTRTDFVNLWRVVLIRNLWRIATLGFIFLVPNTTRFDMQHPRDILQSGSENIDLETNRDSLQLLPLKARENV